MRSDPQTTDLAADLTTLECRVIDAAMALSRCAAEFDGDLAVCSEYLDALWTACDALGTKRTELAGGFTWP